jgi:hypothetical protein
MEKYPRSCLVHRVKHALIHGYRHRATHRGRIGRIFTQHIVKIPYLITEQPVKLTRFNRERSSKNSARRVRYFYVEAKMIAELSTLFMVEFANSPLHPSPITHHPSHPPNHNALIRVCPLLAENLFIPTDFRSAVKDDQMGVGCADFVAVGSRLQ